MSTIKKLCSVLCAQTLLLAPTYLSAQTPAALNALPVVVQSDTATYNMNENTAKHTGQVVMTQGTRELKSDELIVQRDEDGHVVLCIAQGHPATYAGVFDLDETPVLGQADEIRYNPSTATLSLTGNAMLTQNNYQFKGSNLMYDLNAKKMLSHKSESARPTIVIQPNDNG